MLLATTHWLDGHADHAALGRFVRRLNGELEQPRAVAYAVIHAHTPKATAHPDCWYPGPPALVCPCAGAARCALEDPTWVATLARHHFRPDWPAALPDDADYGEEKRLCLSERVYQGEEAAKLRAVRAYASQLGNLALAGSHPEGLAGLMDCNGYLGSFVRSTEAFALIDRAVIDIRISGFTSNVRFGRRSKWLLSTEPDGIRSRECCCSRGFLAQ